MEKMVNGILREIFHYVLMIYVLQLHQQQLFYGLPLFLYQPNRMQLYSMKNVESLE
jgi:hypothetical protein